MTATVRIGWCRGNVYVNIFDPRDDEPHRSLVTTSATEAGTFVKDWAEATHHRIDTPENRAILDRVEADGGTNVMLSAPFTPRVRAPLIRHLMGEVASSNG